MTLTTTTRRRIGDTGLEVTALGIGSAPLGGLYAPVPVTDAVGMLKTAWDLGIRYFDTAPMYGLTRSEHLVGHVLREEDGSHVISTKVGRLMHTERTGRQLGPEAPKNPFDAGWSNPLPFREIFDYSYDGVMRSYDDSQQRLGMDRIDILYVHDIGRITHGAAHEHHWNALTRGGGFRALQELRAAGNISAFGLGVNEWEVIRDALNETDLDICLLAGRYTLLDRAAERDFLPLAQARGVSLAIAGVYNSGILAAPPNAAQKFDYVDAAPEIVARVTALRSVCDDHNVPLAAAAIRFPMRHPAATCVVIGARNPAQLRQNAEWFDTPLPEALWADLDTALAAAG